MKIEKVSVYDLKPYDKNNKIHSEKQIQEIQKSIADFGFLQPCVITKYFEIVIGHGRAEAYKKLVELGTQPKEIDCVLVENLTQKQIRKLRLLDNKLSDMSEWDIENIKFELEELDDSEVNELFIDMEESEDIDFDNISSNEDRDKKENSKEVACPMCEHKFKV